MRSAIPITACVLQYLDHTIAKPGLYLMGNVVDPEKLMADLTRMGIKIEEQTNL